MNPFVKWRKEHPELGLFIEVPRVDKLVEPLRDEQVAAMLERILKEPFSGRVEKFATSMACTRELERRGRIDLLEKILGRAGAVS